MLEDLVYKRIGEFNGTATLEMYMDYFYLKDKEKMEKSNIFKVNEKFTTNESGASYVESIFKMDNEKNTFKTYDEVNENGATGNIALVSQGFKKSHKEEWKSNDEWIHPIEKKPEKKPFI